MTNVQGSPGRRERKKSATRSRLIDSAVALFGDRGIDAVTVEEIAERADVGKGTVYNYFRTKEDMIVAFMTDLEQRVQAEVEESLDYGGHLDKVLSQFVEIQLKLKEPHHAFVRVFLGQMFERATNIEPYVARIQEAMDPPLMKMFARLRSDGIIRADVDLDSLVIAFKTLQLGVISFWAIEGPPFAQTTEVLRTQMRIFAEGLREVRP